MKKSKKEKDDLRLKIQFYVLSLWLLFVLIFLLSVDIPISFDKEAEFIGFWPLIQRNWLAIISLFMMLMGMVITTSYFTQKARQLAEQTGVILWDRDKLEEKIYQLK